MELKNGYAFKPSDWQEDGLPIIRIQNLNNPDALFNHFPGLLPDGFRIRTGDLLFAWSGTPGTSFGAHIWRGEDAWLNQHIFRVDFDSRFLDERFLRLAINHNLDNYIFQAHGGAGLAHITKGKFESSELMIAPLPEQRRIVAKIEELFSDLDAGVAALERAKAKLRRYRAAVLKAAVEGKLTEEWRKQRTRRTGIPACQSVTQTVMETDKNVCPPGAVGRQECLPSCAESWGAIETGPQLLERILKERRRKWEEDQLAAYAKADKKPPANWKGKYKEPAAPDETNLPALPEGWCWASLSQVGVLDRGRSRHRPRNSPHLYGGPYPFVQTGDIGHANTYVRTFSQTYSEAGLPVLLRRQIPRLGCVRHWRNAAKAT